MKKIITFLICLPLFINAQSGISIDTLYSGTNTDVLIYNHSIDFTANGSIINLTNGFYALTNINVINADTATATIYCNPITYDMSIISTYIYKYDVATDDVYQITSFSIVDTLNHNLTTTPLFANLADTISLGIKWEKNLFDINSFAQTGSFIFGEAFKLNNTGVSYENGTTINIYSADSLFKNDCYLNSTAQTGFQTFYYCYTTITFGATLDIDTIAIIDSAIFINSPLTGSSSISGTITAGSGKINSELLENLLVYLIDENNYYAYATQTNSDGYFIFENTETGNYKIVAGDKYNEQFSVTGGDNLSLSFKDGKLETVISSINTIQKEHIPIFPNPTSKYITIELLDNEKLTSVKIVNLQGQEVRSLNKPKTKIDISDLENGVYIVRLDYNGKFKSYKFIKN